MPLGAGVHDHSGIYGLSMRMSMAAFAARIILAPRKIRVIFLSEKGRFVSAHDHNPSIYRGDGAVQSINI